MIKKCELCGKDFKTYPSKVKIGRGKYCSKECCHKVTDNILKHNGEETRIKKGSIPRNFKGYTFTQSRAVSGVYKLIHMPEHPFCSAKGYVREHRLVIEQHIGRYLKEDEIVHHKDSNTLNNNISNLELMKKVEHDRMNTGINIHKRWEKDYGSV